MSRALDRWLSARLAAWVDGVRLRHRAWLALCLAATLLLGVYAGLHLGIDSNNLALVSEDLPARRNHAAFAELFPNLENALLVVVDAETPEGARKAAERLEERLRAIPERFEQVYAPGSGEFFLRHGLLYRSVADLEDFVDRIAGLQPVIAALERDASLASLTSLVRRGLEERQSELAAEDWPQVLDRISQATLDVYAEYPVAISWEELLVRGSPLETSTRQVIVVHAALDFGSPVAAARAVQRIHDEARDLDLAALGARVRVTGNPALNYEEMLGIAWDIGLGGVFCFLLVAAILRHAFGSWKLAAAAISTLLLGLVWAAAIAAATVGHLTVVSLSVAILFIGLGVDFAIHLGMRYAQGLRSGLDHARALRQACLDVGGSLVLCTVTTAIGFLVFVPTEYTGVAELGLIAGLSMLAIAFLTFSFFPALLSGPLTLRGEVPAEHPLLFEERLGRAVGRHPRGVRLGALLLFGGGLAALSLARFDPNVVDLRDPATESVQAMNDLLAQTGTASPWYVDAIAPDLDEAQRLARELERLEPVEQALSLADYVPEDQEEKLALLDELAFLLGPPGSPTTAGAPPTAAEQVEALRALRDFLAEGEPGDAATPLALSMQRLRRHLDDFLAQVEADGDPRAALARLEDLLLSNLSDQIAQLRSALAAGPVERHSLPPDLAARMLAPDGRARIQVYPRHNLRGEGELRDFTEAVSELAPTASGIAFNLLAFEEATKSSFVQALLSAAGLIALLLLGLWRRVGDSLLVMTPLVMSAVLAVGAMGLLGIAFNFVNVIVIPLMFGIGVDSGIHLVHRARALQPGAELLGTSTARAVFYSALTTTVSFGSLGLSSHVGMSSLGVLLTIGMLLTVLCNLVVLPALLALNRRP